MHAYPGEKLGNEIEYAAGDGTYSENEEVIAAEYGIVNVDNRTRTISVKSVFKRPVKINVGQRWYAFVESVNDTSASLILLSECDSKSRSYTVNSFAVLRIENAKRPGTFLKTMKDIMRIGDLVKVEILRVTNGAIDVSMKDEELGVIKAFCKTCRAPLKLTKDNKLFCAKCERYESRKVSPSYLEKMGEGGV